MKYKATTTFAGRVTMRAGEVQDLDKVLAEPLLKSGYLEPVEKAEEEPVTDKDEVKEKESERTDAGSDLQSPSGTAGESKSRRRKSD